MALLDADRGVDELVGEERRHVELRRPPRLERARQAHVVGDVSAEGGPKRIETGAPAPAQGVAREAEASRVDHAGTACVTALLDGFVQHCHILDIDADSWRQKESLALGERRPKPAQEAESPAVATTPSKKR